MRPDLEKLKRDIEEWIKSDEGIAHFEKEKKKNEIMMGRYLRFEKWLETNDFDLLIQRLIDEHDDNYRNKCLDKGYEPYCNRKLSFIFGYIARNCQRVDVPELDSDFPNEIWFFNGYYFQVIYGQGSINVIYDKDYNNIFSI